MRLEATITDVQGAQLDEVVEELKTTKSQIIEEALALFLKAFMETKRGRRVARQVPLRLGEDARCGVGRVRHAFSDGDGPPSIRAQGVLTVR